MRKRRREFTPPTRNESDIRLSLSDPCMVRLIRLHVKEGDSVRTGDFLASCRKEEGDWEDVEIETIELKSSLDGTITKILFEENAVFESSSSIMKIQFCEHNVVLSGLCVDCGRAISDPNVAAVTKRATATVNVEGGVRLEVTKAEAMNVRESTVTRLFQSKRLSLVLDLDHTLVHCTDDPKAMEIAKSAPPGILHTFELDGKLLVLKLRAGLSKFLHSMKDKYFEMHVYTAGTRAYAEKVCEIIDPTKDCFGHRIIARDDTPELGLEKSLTRIFPVDDTMVVVVDDRDVWRGVRNLLTCEPFIYFRGMHDVNNAGWHTISGEDGSDQESNEINEGEGNGKAVKVVEGIDPGLARVEDLLKIVHRNFYFSKPDLSLQDQLNGHGSDVKIILRDLRMTVLKKVVVAFDPEIPKDYLESLFIKARNCGAKCSEEVNKNITHLISPKETELALFGKQLGIWVVKPEWLEKSEHYWQGLKEEPFSVFRTYGRRPKSAPPILTTSTTSQGTVDNGNENPNVRDAAASITLHESNEEDEEFARELEMGFEKQS